MTSSADEIRGTARNHPRRLAVARGAPHRIRVAFVLHAMQVAGAEVLVMETVRRVKSCVRKGSR
jgi:hypothetical protein